MNVQLITVAEVLDRYKAATKRVAAGVKSKIAARVGPVTCRPECSYCCYQKILTSPYMGIFIYLYLKREGKWTPELRAKLVQADIDMTARTHKGWLMGRRPCPFLDEKSFGRGVCTVYPVRPEACAVTHSVSGDGALCAVPGGNNLVSVVDSDAVEPFLIPVMAVQRFCKPVVVTLPASVLLAEAAIEKKPVPSVASIPIPVDQAVLRNVEAEFDGRYATVPDGE